MACYFCFLLKGEHIHRTNGHTNSTTNAGAVPVVQYFLFEGIGHDIDSHLAISGALITGNTFFVGIYMKFTDSDSGIKF
jgi:hypothetical protein